MIIGRVFEDLNRNGKFDSSDKPVSGARLYLTNGQSVITDSEGLYNFPAVGDGSQVIALDPVTLPGGFALADGNSLSGRTWTRLLRTPVGGGAMLRQNFILIGSGNTSSELASEQLSEKRDNKSGTSRNKQDQQTNAAATNRVPAPVNPSDPSRGAAGVYEFATTETLDPVAPGTALILSPARDSVVMAPAMEVVARVALNWTVKLEVNGEQISEKNIGMRRVDNKLAPHSLLLLQALRHPVEGISE